MRTGLAKLGQLFIRTSSGHFVNKAKRIDFPKLLGNSKSSGIQRRRFVSTSGISLGSTQIGSQPQAEINVKTGIMAPTKINEEDLSRYILPLNQPVVTLDCDVAFNGLTSKEKLYAHYLSQAAWYGGLIVPVQTSPESTSIFAILLDLFKSNGIEGLKEIALNTCNFSENDWKALLVYTTGVFGNAGNYKSFGDTKIIPGVSVELVDDLISKAKFLGMSAEEVKEKWEAVKGRMYSLSDREKQLGLGDKGITTYFSTNCTLEDSDLVNRFMKEKNIEGWMTRVFKTSDGATNAYEIRTAAVNSGNPTGKVYDFENATFTLTTGDYSYLLEQVCKNLGKAKEYASNDIEVQMLDCYIKSFTEGSLEEHKNGSRFWIADKGPAIETYIGFIENYRDPSGIRSEFEGFVSVVNRPMSEMFQLLVDNAMHFLTLLPWPKEFDKDAFLKPDFTSLDVLTFAGSGIPAGINIPNYDEIRQHEGFKNVSLGNVIPASYKDSQLPFLSEPDKVLFNEHRIISFEVQVGLHELLGHGSGKLFSRDENGVVNFPAGLMNPVTNQPVTGTYGPGDTYSSVFTSLASAYEECRAESVGLYLSLFDEVLKIFGLEGDKAQDVKYVNWLSMVYAGAKSLEMYQPETCAWMQAHSKARFVILQVLTEAGQGLVTVVETVGEEGKPDLLISVDRSKIDTVGREAMRIFLQKLNVYKATADIKEATKMFEAYAAVHNDGTHPWAKWRSIILDKKQPRKAFVQHNTVVDGESVVLKTYESTHEGLIQSWIERFEGNAVYKGLDVCWLKDKPYF